MLFLLPSRSVLPNEWGSSRKTSLRQPGPLVWWSAEATSTERRRLHPCMRGEAGNVCPAPRRWRNRAPALQTCSSSSAVTRETRIIWLMNALGVNKALCSDSSTRQHHIHKGGKSGNEIELHSLKKYLEWLFENPVLEFFWGWGSSLPQNGSAPDNPENPSWISPRLVHHSFETKIRRFTHVYRTTEAYLQRRIAFTLKKKNLLCFSELTS